MYVGDFVIKQHFCWRDMVERGGPYIVEIISKKSKMGKYGQKPFRKYIIKGKCVYCDSIIDIYDDDKIIDKEAGRFIKCLLEQ